MILKRANASLPSTFGEFKIYCFSDGKKEHIALVKGEVSGKEHVLTRIHSECLTGDVFGSLRCDCRAQLEKALEKISAAKEGIVLYLRQEGRGIGLLNKIKAYKLQEEGKDTIEANIDLGFKEDERDFTIAAEILNQMGVKSIRLLTNNPEKRKVIEQAEISVVREELITTVTEHNHKYLETKKEKMGHLL